MRLKITAKNKTTQKSALTSAKPQRATPAAGVEAAEKAIERELDGRVPDGNGRPERVCDAFP